MKKSPKDKRSTSSSKTLETQSKKPAGPKPLPEAQVKSKVESPKIEKKQASCFDTYGWLFFMQFNAIFNKGNKQDL